MGMEGRKGSLHALGTARGPWGAGPGHKGRTSTRQKSPRKILLIPFLQEDGARGGSGSSPKKERTKGVGYKERFRLDVR